MKILLFSLSKLLVKLAVAVTFCPAWLRGFRHAFTRVSGRHFHGPRRTQVQQTLEVVDVVDGRTEGLHFAQSLLVEFPRQVLPEPRVTVVHAAHSVTLPLVSLPNERRLEGVVAHPAEIEMSAEGQVSQATGERLTRGVQVGRVEAERECERVLAAVRPARLVRGDAVAER